MPTAPRDTLVPGSTEWNKNMDAMVHMGAGSKTAARTYHAIKGEAYLDSGANINIFKLENEPYLTQTTDSDYEVSGFSGNDVQANKDGTASLYIFDKQHPGDGVHIDVPATTMKGDANANLISAWIMVKQMGFSLNLSPDGKEDGFTRKEPDGSTTALPAESDATRGLWIIHFTISHSAAQSRKLAYSHHAVTGSEQHDGISNMSRARDRLPDFPDGCHGFYQLPQLCREGAACSTRELMDLIDDHLDAGDGVQSADSKFIEGTSFFLNQCNTGWSVAMIGKAIVPTIEPQNGAAASTDDHLLVDVEDEEIYKESESVIKPSQRPHDRQMIQRVRHFKLGHHGPCPGGCDICKQTSGTLRKVMKGGSPSFDDEVGRTCGMDSIYWDVESRHGNKYTCVIRDERTLWIGGFHMARRSDATRLFKKFILKVRTDPELNCPDFCKRLRIDNAGEWSAVFDVFKQVCVELGIEILQPPSKSDHRMNSLAESAVFLTKLHAQRVLLGTRLEWNMWEEAVDFVWFIRQHTVTKRVASPHGKGPAPLTELSRNNVDYAECDRRKDYAWPPGTLALVHDPGKHGGAADITHARYGRVIKMEKDVVVFESLRTPKGKDIRSQFRSKNFSVIHLHEGISALQWAGLEVKNLPKACMPEVELSRFTTIVELSNLYPGSKAELPIIKGSTCQGDAPLPGVITTDSATGRIYEEKDGVLHPTDGHVNIIPPGLSDESTESKRIEILSDRLATDPSSFIGCEVHRLFETHGGIYRGRVLEYDVDAKYWQVRYDCDERAEEYDTDDMIDYAIRYMDGRAPADGGAAQWIKHCQQEGAAMIEGHHDPSPEPELQPALMADGENEWYLTKNNDTFYSICEAIGIDSTQQRMYFDWLVEHFKIGNVKKKCTVLFFPNPVGKADKWTHFEKGERFPKPIGDLWTQHLTNYEQGSNGNMCATADSAIQQNVKVILAAEKRRVEWAVVRDHRLIKESCSSSGEYEQIRLHSDLEIMAFQGTAQRQAGGASHALPSDLFCWAEVDEKSREMRERPDKLEAHRLCLHSQNKHIDSKGIPIAPKSMADLQSWDDDHAEIWNEAIDKEWNGLNDRECFEHDLTKKQLADKGIHRKPIGMRMLLESKISDGKFTKAKARNVAQGHKGNLTKGVDYTTVFAAAPDLATGRIIQCLCVLFNFVRATMDIMQAYLIGKAEEGQRYPTRYPAGRIREEHRCKKTGEERYALLIGNLYGMPTASRVYSIERDRLLNEELPKRWPDVTVKQCMYEPCLFMIERKGIGYVSIHVDDCDGAFEYAEDAEFWMHATNELFKTEKQPGIKAVDPEVMLGVTRKLSTSNGVRYVRLGQQAYIEQMWEQWGHYRAGKRVPTTPMPQQVDKQPPAIDTNMKPVGVTDKEAREVHEMGYRNLIGELLWPSRNTAPGIAAGIGLLSKCVHRPSWGAWFAALHMLHFLYATREDGIQFRSDGNLEPCCYFDSGFYQDLIGHKPQYGFVIYWAGGPLIWKSKKHTNIPLNTSEAEYMALCHAWRHVKWLRSLLTEMGFENLVSNPTKIYGDNKNANDWAAEKMISDGNRHIDICYMKIRERVALGEIMPTWIKGKLNPSDLLTKIVTKDVVDALMKTLQGLVPIPGSTTRDVDDEAHDMVMSGDMIHPREDMLSQVMMAEIYDIVSRRAEPARLRRNLAAI